MIVFVCKSTDNHAGIFKSYLSNLWMLAWRKMQLVHQLGINQHFWKRNHEKKININIYTFIIIKNKTSFEKLTKNYLADTNLCKNKINLTFFGPIYVNLRLFYNLSSYKSYCWILIPNITWSPLNGEDFTKIWSILDRSQFQNAFFILNFCLFRFSKTPRAAQRCNLQRSGGYQ